MLRDVNSYERNGYSGCGDDYDEFFIELIYLSDYIYATDNCYDKENNTSTNLGYSTSASNDYRACISDNWLHTNIDCWMINNSIYEDTRDIYKDAYKLGKAEFTSLKIAIPNTGAPTFPVYIAFDGKAYN